MRNILIADIMTRDPITAKPNINLLECAKKMVKKRVGSLLILDKKNLVGFISQKDILWALTKKSKKDLSKIRAIDVSPKKIATVKPSSTIEEATDKMKKFRFYRLPVVKDGELVGMVTVRDILNFYPELHRELSELELIREEVEKLKRIKKAKGRKVINEGICEECGNRDTLYRVNGMLICSSCMSSI